MKHQIKRKKRSGAYIGISIMIRFSQGFELSRTIFHQQQYSLPRIVPTKHAMVKKTEGKKNKEPKKQEIERRGRYSFWRCSGVSLTVPTPSTSRRKVATAVLIWKIPAATACDGDWFRREGGLGPPWMSWKLMADGIMKLKQKSYLLRDSERNMISIQFET